MKFLRRASFRHSKLGKGRKKKQVWRRPTGRDNKMREQIRGKPAVVKIGYRKQETEKMKVIRNINDIAGLEKGDRVVLGNVGAKKKIELVKNLNERKIDIANLNTKRFLKHVSVRQEKAKIHAPIKEVKK